MRLNEFGSLILVALAVLMGGGNTLVIGQNNQDPPNAKLVEASELTSSLVQLFREAKYDEALPLAKRVLELREAVLPKDADSVNAAVLNLAEVQYARAKFEESKTLFERVLHSYEQTIGPESPRLIHVLDRLAINYHALGQPGQTEKFYKRALSISEKSAGADQTELANALYYLAEFYQFQGEYPKAEPLYQRLVDIQTKTDPHSDASTEALDRYACLLRKENRESEALQVETREFGVPLPAGSSGNVIDSGILNGKALRLFTPPYPAEARLSRASGKVTVRVVINEGGNVIRACAVEGPKLLMKASESAALRSKFSPTTLNGKPVKVNGKIIYNFVAQ